MIEDIKPPKRKVSPPVTTRTMPSTRLQGHTAIQAKARTVTDQATSSNSSSEPEEPQILSEVNEHPFKDTGNNRTGIKHHIWHNHKKILLISTISALLLTIGGGLAFYFNKPSKPTAKTVIVSQKVEPPKPVIITSPLTGAVTTAELAKRPVTAIMIENSPDARPQSGLRDAGVVYEAIAEGGITRFLTLFQESTPQYIGPVRSIRPYYLDWLAPFDAPVAHVGGSLDALTQVRSGMKDLDQFFNGGSYARISSRYAPHNVYTSFAKLDALNASKGFTSSNFTGWPRKEEKKLAVPTAASIDMNISGFFYNVHYDFDPNTNTYMRYEATKPHVDTVSADDKAGAQLHPKVVIALHMYYDYGPSNDGARSSYGTTGTGRMQVFQDGGVTEGTWSKADRKSQFEFKDAAGASIRLNPGQTWLTVVSDPNAVSYKP